GSEPLLIAGTYREIEVERGDPLAETLAALVREPASESLTLGGLSREDVARFIEQTAEVKPPPELIVTVFHETEGNPLFITELVRLLLVEGRLDREGSAAARRLTIPQSVYHVIGRRLDLLSSECNRTLTLAAVIGREFSLAALERAGDLSGDALLEVMEEAEQARVIQAVPERPGRYSFSHPLIQETLTGQLLASRRMRLHRQVGEALEQLYAANLDPHLAELAHHFVQAAPGGDVEKAVSYAVRAAERSRALLAYEEA